MVVVDILKFPISSPADTSPLQRLEDAGHTAADVIAVVGKTEGNGCVNDFSRTLAATVWTPLLPKDVVTVFSGGTEGVLSPHVTFIVRLADGETGLMASATHTAPIRPGDIGTQAQALQVEEACHSAIASLAPHGDAEVHLVLVKCPLLTSTQIEQLARQGRAQTTDTYESMAISRKASALGVAYALGEHPKPTRTDAKSLSHLLPLPDVACSRASCSSGAELSDCHILVLATSKSIAASRKARAKETSVVEQSLAQKRLAESLVEQTNISSPALEPSRRPSLRAVSGIMEDAIDAKSVMTLLKKVEDDGGEVVQVFAKAEADPRGNVRGHRHTMNTDSDVHSTRHARAAVGGLLAGLVGDPQIYVSGGAEGQGPPGGGSLCIVYRCRE